MNNYSIVEQSKRIQIVENKTGHIVFTSKKKGLAYKQLTFFNMGGAFDGWTPSFFLIEMPKNSFPDVD